VAVPDALGCSSKSIPSRGSRTTAPVVCRARGDLAGAAGRGLAAPTVSCCEPAATQTRRRIFYTIGRTVHTKTRVCQLEKVPAVLSTDCGRTTFHLEILMFVAFPSFYGASLSLHE
jgi:hypothetical protein